jgi:hypothetical protein
MDLNIRQKRCDKRELGLSDHPYGRVVKTIPKPPAAG